ncbi:retrovirus-related pol polyprotein from transposon TNT 1-94 [Tanacetum coccineum]|uniref:Retrovirus-related pol polyprotein from transposon TNT 1-94 n=1 Tax=Tanacetum coccineum TaxID=301880 RepID=A0ABQ5D032_9ASTR
MIWYQALKKKPVTVAQARKNMMVQSLFKKNTDVEMTKKKRVAEEALLQESFKELRTAQALGSEAFQEQSTEETKEFSKEDLKTLLEIVPVEEFRVEALQTNFEDMLKAFDREDLDTLWSLVKEKFRSVEPTEDMERALRVELKRLYEPDKEDTLWKLQRYMHDPLTWRLYGSCAVHHVFSTRGHCIYLLPEKDYPLTTEVMMLMLSRRLQVEEDISLDLSRLDTTLNRLERSIQIGININKLGSSNLVLNKLGSNNLGAQGNCEAGVFQVSNNDAAVTQRRLEDKQLEEKTNTDCLVMERETVHLGIKVGENITVTEIPGQEGAEGNVSEKKKVKESMEANLGKLLKYNAWSTRILGMSRCESSKGTPIMERAPGMETSNSEEGIAAAADAQQENAASPSDTKENRIMVMKLEYHTFRAKSTESLSQTYTRYKTLLNELANDGVNLSKHEINVGLVNSLPEKWLTFSQGLRNANHTQTLDLADIYGSTPISTAFFSNNVIQDFQENSDDEVDERSGDEYLRDLDIEYQERALLANSKRFIKRRNNFLGQKANKNTECYKCGNKGHFARDYFSKTSEPSYKSLVNNYSSVSKGFQPKFTTKLIQSSLNSNSQADPKFQKDYKAEYKKMKARLALLEASPLSSQNPKTFQPKNKGLVAETFDWDEEEVTQVKVLMALADDELTVRKNHARNGEWVDITIRKVNTLLTMDEDADWKTYLKYINIDLKFFEDQQLNLIYKYNKMVFELNKCRDELLILKQAKLDAATFQIQNTELTKLNHAL